MLSVEESEKDERRAGEGRGRGRRGGGRWRRQKAINLRQPTASPGRQVSAVKYRLSANAVLANGTPSNFFPYDIEFQGNKAVYTALVAPNRPKKNALPTDQPTDGRTDTPSYKTASRD